MVLTIAYGAGSAALLVLLLLILLGSRPEGAGRAVVVACATTLAWTGACALDISRLAGLTQILEDARSAAWVFFLGALLESPTRSQGTSGLRYMRVLTLAFGA